MESVVTGSRQPKKLDVRDLRVLVTGHTGFKGAWLCEWLLESGARVYGIALPPEPDSLFAKLELADRVAHIVCDIRNTADLSTAFYSIQPDIVFHLAAQSLVRRGYRDPVTTWETNVMGTINVLEAARSLARPVTVIAVTSDKVYRNREWEYAYRETDELGGHDPYSASKAACELAVSSWRASFGGSSKVQVVTARSGNVLGAGDMGEDRLVPDCFRAWGADAFVHLRNPNATRPWQHVLDPLSGYIMMAAHVRSSDLPLTTCNFGPGPQGDRTVRALVEELSAHGPGRQWKAVQSESLHEASRLSLCIDRARIELGWAPSLSFSEAVAWTDAGYVAKPSELRKLIRRQISEFQSRNDIFVA